MSPISKRSYECLIPQMKTQQCVPAGLVKVQYSLELGNREEGGLEEEAADVRFPSN